MFKKACLALIIILLLAGCSGDIVPQPEKPGGEGMAEQVYYGGEKDTVFTVIEDEENKASELPEQEHAAADEEQPQKDPLISKEETVRMFLSAWEEKDLERMNMLTTLPLEDFFRNSDVSFASYHYLEEGDLAGFIRDALETLKAYDIKAFSNCQISTLATQQNRLLIRMGDAFDLDFTLVMDQNMWKLELMDSLPVEQERAIPQDWQAFGQTVIVDVGDMDGDGFVEMLAMGLWGDWEGMGPEPSSAIGIYSYDGQGLETLYFNDINKRLTDGRVVVEGGGMGHLVEDGPFGVALVERTAVDSAGVVYSPGDVEYFLCIYSLGEGGRLERVEEIDWKALVCSGVKTDLQPKSLEILGVKNLSGASTGNIIVKVMFETIEEGIEEGIFVISRGDNGWKVDWCHIGVHGEYHSVIFEQPCTAGSPVKFYYIEDGFEEDAEGRIYEVRSDGQQWVEVPVLTGKPGIKAVGDMDGDGGNEFLVWDGVRLKVVSRQGDVLWEAYAPDGTKEVPYAWIGRVGDKQWVIVALHRGAYVHWKSQIFIWEGEGYNLEMFWNSEDLGTQGIWGMIVCDMDGDLTPEIIANFSNHYLVRGQFLKIFKP